MKGKVLVALAFLFASLTCTLWAQSPTGTITGEVLDPSGAAVANASVQITNVGTNETKQVTTDASGHFSQPFLTPGKYNVQVTAAGFQSARQENVEVNVAENRPVNFSLALGNVSTQVEVQATTPPLQTESATVGQVISGRQVVDLPLNGRNPFALATLAPTVNSTGVTGGGTTPHIGGSRNAVSEVMIDGMTDILPENNVGNTSYAYTPVLDSVQEFNVQVNSLSAEYGRFGGGVISVVTKSGTNEVHGDGFFFARNSVMDASNFFSGGVKGDFHRYQTGGTLGGPIVIPHVYNGKDKSFFFFGFEDTHQASQQTANETVPTVAERNGDFSALLGSAVGTDPCTGATVLANQIYDPTRISLAPNGKTYCRTPIPGNNIAAYVASGATALRLDPVALKALTFFPNPTNSGLTNNYVANGVDTSPTDHWDSRFDQNWTEKYHMFLRVSHQWSSDDPFADYGVNNPASTGYGGPSSGGAWSASLDNTFTLSPSLILDLRYGLTRSAYSRVPYGVGFNPTTLGLPAYTAQVAQGEELQFPYFNFNGINNNNGLGTAGWVGLLENPTAHDVFGSITKIAGNHTIKIGGEFRKLFLNFYQWGQPDGEYSFSKNWTQELVGTPNGTGDPIAAFMLGLLDNGGSQTTHDISFATASSYMAYYIQDDWKVTRTFTLNLGLRWDVEFPRTERYNRLSYWNPNAPSPIAGQVSSANCPACSNLMGAMEFVNTPGAQYGRAQGPVQWKDFGPRVGFAWNTTPKTVIRAGFGIAYLPSALEAAGTSGAAGTQGFASSTGVNSTLTNYQTLNQVNGQYVTLSNPYPAGYNLPTGTAAGASTYLGQGIGDSFFDSYRNPYTIQWNFNIQRELPGQMTLELGYIGNHSLFLVNGDPGVPYSQDPTSYLALGSALEQQVANPFYGIIKDPTSPLSAPTVSRNQLLSPFPQYTAVQAFRKPDAASRYNGFVASLNKRFSSGLTFGASYTMSKTISNSGAAVSYLGAVAGTYIDQYNPGLQWSLDPQDVSQIFTGSFTYELPFGHGKHFGSGATGFTNLLMSGWSVNGIFTTETGTPLIIAAAGNDAGLKNPYPEPVLSTGISAGLSNPTPNLWFNPAAFAEPGQYQLGNLSRTVPNVRNPGYTNLDFSLFKNNYFGHNERFNLQLRFEAFNALNHPQFGPPNTNINSSTVGQITGMAPNYNPRDIQLATKFIF